MNSWPRDPQTTPDAGDYEPESLGRLLDEIDAALDANDLNTAQRLNAQARTLCRLAYSRRVA